MDEVTEGRLDLDPIRERLSAATPGPWVAAVETHPKDRYWNGRVVYAVDVERPLPNLVYTGHGPDDESQATNVERWDDAHTGGYVCETHGYSTITDDRHDANQRLIAHAPDDLRALIAEVERLRAGDAALDDEMQVQGHKVFVFERAGSPWIEMVNDDRPLVRMTLQLLSDEARGVARALTDAADATTVDPHACCKRHVPGPIFTTFDGDPQPEFICPECGGRWLWEDDEAEGGGWFWDPENDRAEGRPT